MKSEIRSKIEQIRHGNVPEGYRKTKAGILPADWKVDTAEKGYITLLPHKTGTDGFFISRMRRKD